MNRKSIICTGGTGGHVIPAVNFGNFLLDKGEECFLIVDKRGLKFSKSFNGKIYIINSSHLNGNFFYKLKSCINLIIGFFQSFYIIYKVRPNICVSFGSYATFNPLIIIVLLKFFFRIKIFIHEQNSILGKVNLFFLKYADILFSNFSEIYNLKPLYKKKFYFVGLPENLKTKSFIHKKRNSFGKKNIFIYGGSQGSVHLINYMLLILQNLESSYLSKIKVFIQSPIIIFDKLNLFFSKIEIDYEIKEFYYNIDEILSKTDIAITRAGAGTINDIIKYRIPSLIMPLPTSIYDHQLYNAKFLTNIKAAILMDQNNFKIDTDINTFKKLIDDDKQQEIMKKALKEIIIPNANLSMYKKIIL